MSAATASACRGSRAVPSRSLLRFLKLQSDAAFSSQSFCSNHSSLRQRACRRAYSSKRKQTVTCETQALASGSNGSTFVVSAVNSGRLSVVSRRGFGTTTLALKDEKQPSDSSPQWQERLWGNSAKPGTKPLQPDDLPSHDSEHDSTVFSNRRTMAAKAALEPRLRCTEVDENGKVILVDGEFKKTELIQKVGPCGPSGWT